MDIVIVALFLLFPVLFGIAGAYLVYKALTTTTTLLWRSTGLVGGLSLLLLVGASVFTFLSGCGADSECSDPWFVDQARNVGLILFAVAVVLLFAASVDQHLRTWRRSS
jgi:hypothetical protein